MRKVIILGLAAALMFAFTGCNTFEGMKQDLTNVVSAVEESVAIVSADTAKAAAIKHAGLDGKTISSENIHLEFKGGRNSYNYRFVCEGGEYEYDIDASTGAIIGYTSKVTDTASLPAPTTTAAPAEPAASAAPAAPAAPAASAAPAAPDVTQPSVPADANMITADAAADIALAKVPGATRDNLKIELEQESTGYEYDGEIKYAGIEYEFEIDAYTGEILEWKTEVAD